MLSGQTAEADESRMRACFRQKRLSLEESVCVRAVDVPRTALTHQRLQIFRARVKLRLLLLNIALRLAENTRDVQGPLASEQDVNSLSARFLNARAVLFENPIDVTLDKVVAKVLKRRVSRENLTAQHVTVDSRYECDSQTFDLSDARTA